MIDIIMRLCYNIIDNFIKFQKELGGKNMKMYKFIGKERLEKIRYAHNLSIEIAQEWAEILEFEINSNRKLSLFEVSRTYKIINLRLKSKITMSEIEYLRIIKRSIEILLDIWEYKDYLMKVVDEVNEKFNPMLDNCNVMSYELLYNRDYQILSYKIDIMLLLFGSDLEIEYNDSLQKDVMETYTQIVRTLIDTVDVKDSYTGGHIDRVSKIAESFGKTLELSEENLEELLIASKLHDVGKIGISETILTKEGKLSLKEYNEMKKHTQFGELIVRGIPGFGEIAKIIKYHHERYDGEGYYNLSPDLIPENVYIISLCDAFDAMNSNRSYRVRLDFDTIIAEYKKCSGHQFEPKLCEKFINFLHSNTEYIKKIYELQS